MTDVVEIGCSELEIIEAGNAIVNVNNFINNFNGGGGDTKIVIDFTWNVTNPFSLGTIASGRRLIQVLIGITIPFNNGATISIGDSGVNDRFMTTNQNYPAIAEEFTSSPFYKFALNTEILLSFGNNSLTNQGAGTVILYFDS